MNKEIGRITKKIIRILKLDYDEEQPIFVGDANIKHMQAYNKCRKSFRGRNW